jgi:hypothetical protein
MFCRTHHRTRYLLHHIQFVFGSFYDRKQVIIKLSRFVKRQVNRRQPTKVLEKGRLARSRDQRLNDHDMGGKV